MVGYSLAPKIIDLTQESRTVITVDGFILKGATGIDGWRGLVVAKKENNQWIQVFGSAKSIPPEEHKNNCVFYLDNHNFITSSFK